MLRVLFESQNAPKSILCLGAHGDDLEIGCGGTVLRLIEAYKPELYWIVFSSNEKRADEARRSAEILLSSAKAKTVIVKNFKDGYFPYTGGEIKDYFEELKSKISPGLIFTHTRSDLHQDHRLICELTWNTFRDHLILEYEVPKYDGDLGSPNFFVELDESLCRQKVDHIMKSFPSQGQRAWFSEEIFYSMLRLRGMEAASSSNYAEAFYCRKAVF